MPEGTDRHTEEEEGVNIFASERSRLVMVRRTKGARVRLWEGGGGGGVGRAARSIPTKHTAAHRGKDFPGRQESRARINK